MSIETTKESLSQHPPLFALEGMGGSGKSHVIKLLTSQFREGGLEVLECKISGMGTGNRVDSLRKINAERQTLLESGLASEKVKDDKRKDRIFRLGMHYQVRSLTKQMTEVGSNFDLAILDRTPMMPWVYSASNDPTNPFLDEIFNDGLNVTRQIGINSVYVLDVSPETAFARMIGRMCAGQPDAEAVIKDLTEYIKASAEAQAEIERRAVKFIQDNPNLLPKTHEKYSLISYGVMVNERVKFVEAATTLQEKFGTNYKIIDAEKPIDEVVAEVRNDINSNIS